MPLETIKTGARTPTAPANAGTKDVVQTAATPRVLPISALASALEAFQSQKADANQSGGQEHAVLEAAESAARGESVEGRGSRVEGQAETPEELAAREEAEAAARAEALANETPEEKAAREEAETPEEREAREAAEAEAAAEAERLANETPEEKAAREAAEEEADGAADPIGVKKRIAKALEAKRVAEEQLAAAQAEIQLLKAKGGGSQAQAQTSGLEAVTDLNELAQVHARTESALDALGSLQRKLSFAPGQVERFLREQKVSLKDADGNDEFTPERMAEVLDTIEGGLRQTLRAAPARAQWLQNHAKAHETVVKQFPWMTKQGDPKGAFLAAMVKANPAVKAAPDFEYWLGCAVEKHFELEARKSATAKAPSTKIQAPGKIQAPKVATAKAAAPNTGTVGSVAPKVTASANIQAAKAKVMSGGGRAALGEFMAATGRA